MTTAIGRNHTCLQCLIRQANTNSKSIFNPSLQLTAKPDINCSRRIQWYGIAVTADDPMVSYVAAWIGLECIGNVMNSRFHPNGPKVSCRICGNIVGNNRNRKMAGINHIFNLLTKESLSEALSRQAKEVISSELQEVFSFDYARKLRNDSVHPAERIETILQECSRFRRHLFHVLNASILGILGQSTESWITGDYQFHPDARVSLKFYNELEKFPYHGEWMGGLKYEHRHVVWNQGEYHPAGFEFERSLDERTADLVE